MICKKGRQRYCMSLNFSFSQQDKLSKYFISWVATEQKSKNTASEANDAHLDCFDSTHDDNLNLFVGAHSHNLFSSDALLLVCSTWPHQHDLIVLYYLQASEADGAHLNCFVSLYNSTSKGNLV
jgi:hypothetical protein